MSWDEMVYTIRENGGEYRQGINYDTITFRGDGHREAAARIFQQAREGGVRVVYDLFHYDGYSTFSYR